MGADNEVGTDNEVFVVTMVVTTIHSCGDFTTGPSYTEFDSEKELVDWFKTIVKPQKRYCSNIQVYKARRIPCPIELEGEKTI